MLSEIASIRSSFPSAFSALGVGCIGMLGQLPLVSILHKNYPPKLQALELKLSEVALPAVPYIATFAAFFYVYALGFALIAIAARLRGQDPTIEAALLTRLFQCESEHAVKFCFEQRALVETFDGLGFAILMSGTSMALAAFLMPDTSIWVPLISLSLSIGTMLAFWRESGKRNDLIKSIALGLSRKGILE